jgi:hypothetical protein
VIRTRGPFGGRSEPQAAEDSESDSKDSDWEFNFLKLEFNVIRSNASDGIGGHRARHGHI